MSRSPSPPRFLTPHKAFHRGAAAPRRVIDTIEPYSLVKIREGLKNLLERDALKKQIADKLTTGSASRKLVFQGPNKHWYVSKHEKDSLFNFQFNGASTECSDRASCFRKIDDLKATLTAALDKAIKFWEDILNAECDNVKPEPDRFHAIRRFVQRHLYLKLPIDLENKDRDIEVHKAFIPFTAGAVQQTNGVAGSTFISIKDDCRPYVRIPIEYKDEVVKKLHAQDTIQKKVWVGARSFVPAEMKSFLAKVNYDKPIALLGKTFLQALEAEAKLVLPLLDRVAAERKSAGWTDPMIAEHRSQDVCSMLGPLGVIVFFAVFGSDDKIELNHVYNIDLMLYVSEGWLDCVALTNKEIQRVVGDGPQSLERYTGKVDSTGRMYYKDAPCALGGRARRFYERGDRHGGEDEDEDED
jgi:hypothetical protein